MKLTILVFILTLMFLPSAYAYGGPGVAIALLGSIFGFAGVIVGAVFFALLWPCVYAYRYVKARKQNAAQAPEDA